MRILLVSQYFWPETFRINTEDIRLDTRTTKGKQMFKAGIISAAKLPE